jgi:hypothetical protein
MDGPSLTAEDLQSIPKDSPVGIAFKLDLANGLSKIISTVSEIDPNAGKEITQGVDGIKQQLGFDLRQDVLASLGSTWRIYANPDAGGLLTGWTISIPVTNPQKLKPVYEQLMGMAQALTGGPPQPGKPSLNKSDAGGNTIYSVSLPVPGNLLVPSWSLTSKDLLIGSSSVALQSAISGNTGASLAAQPEIAPYLRGAGKPLAIAYLDSKQLSQTLGPLLQGAMGQAKATGVPGAGASDAVAAMPRAALEKYLDPTVVVLQRTPHGVELDMHQTMPLGNVGAMSPIAMAIMLPAILKARGAAQRTQSVNHLKQMGVALHNYSDVQSALPGAYSADANGKPLLSWRVHILPYIEENQLYAKFRLNEPWDSEHTKALIPMMPKIYRAPESHAAAGKTNYLGVAGKSGIFVAPRNLGQPSPLGLKLQQVTDGLSNTAAVVEVNDQNAVIWSKPDDFDSDANEPLKVLAGLRPNGFAVATADGAVRMVSVNIPAGILKALFTYKGGEQVDWSCPHCGAQSLVEDEHLGQSGTCFTCGKPITVPAEVATAQAGSLPGLRAARRTDAAIPFTATAVATLVALGLLVVAVLGGLTAILSGVLVPAARQVSQSSQRRACEDNLRQISMAMQRYHDQHGHFPPAYVADESGKPMHSWRVLLLPYLGQQALYAQYDMKLPWDDPKNRLVAAQMPDVYGCHSDPDTFRLLETSYVVLTGEATMFPGAKHTARVNLVDGASQTILVVEAAGCGIGWTEPRDLDVKGARLLINNRRNPTIASKHADGANVIMADGNVYYLHDGTPQDVLTELSTIDGGEKVSLEPFVLRPIRP